MNIYKALNEMIEYIENNLEEKIDYNRLAKFLGVNTYTLQRLFSLLTNISLAEYIRKRRLTIAGSTLYNDNAKVMDIAIKYQYENATSFSRAFEQFHGIKPSQVTKESKLKVFPRITFEEKESKTEEIPYEIIEKNEITLYGLYIPTTEETIEYDAPKFFQEVRNKYYDKYGEIPYAMVSYEDESRLHCNAYWVMYEKEIKEFTKIVIPQSKWLVFKIPNQNAKDIHDTSQTFYNSFLPSCQFNLSDIPELEYYHDDITEFLVPII